MSPARRSQLLSEVNDRIYDLLQSGEPDLPGEFLCECGRECRQRVVLLPVEFARLRASGESVRSPQCREPGLHLRSPQAADGVPALN